MPEEKSITEQVKWRQQPVTDNELAFNCPVCDKQYAFAAELFTPDQEASVEGVLKTEEVITRHGSSRLLSIILGIVAYYLVHRAMYGPEASLGQGILVPVFVAVLVYSVSEGLWAGFYARFSPKLPVYEVLCRGCQTPFFAATNGKILAVGIKEAGEPNAQSV